MLGFVPQPNLRTNTYTVGFWTVNRKPKEEEKAWNKKPDSWRTSTIVKTVNEIEELTGYDFFSNISSDIQEKIENNREIFFQEGKIPDNFIPNLGLSSPLLSEDVTQIESSRVFAPSNNVFFTPTGSINNTAIRHNSALENSILNINIDGTNQISSNHIDPIKDGIFQISSCKTSILEDSTREVCGVEVNSVKVSTTEVNSFQINGTQASSTEIGIAKIGSPQISVTQLDPFKISIPQIGISEIGVVENAFFEVGTSKIDPLEVSTKETNSFKLKRPEIPFPSSITLQQLLSSHNLSPKITNTFKDNPLNLTLEITDLPTGQLAEAQVIVGWVRRTKTFKNQLVIEIAS